MTKRRALVFRILLAAAVFGFFFVLPAQVERRFNRVRSSTLLEITPSTRGLHERLLIVDLHADSLLWDRDITKRSAWGHVDIPRLRDGNVTLQGFTVVTKVPYGFNVNETGDGFDQVTPLMVAGRESPSTWTSLLARALAQASELNRSGWDNDWIFVRTRRDLQTLLMSRQTTRASGAFLGLEGAHALEGDLKNLDKLYEAGFRSIGLAHFFDNEFAGSAHGKKKGGLTPLGRDLVRAVEAKKMIVDLAHASPQTIRDVLVLATRPVIVSHTGVKGTCNNPRNLSDEELRGIARNGGLIGIGYWQTAVCGTDARAIARAIRYAVSVAGIDHVALGSDFDGAVTMPFDTSQLVQVSQALLDAGFSQDEIKKIMGGNALTFLLKNLPD